MGEVVRFAPSPTGRLHLGHAYSAWFAWEARGAGGRFLLRLEDLDIVRSRREYEASILEDLGWLGLEWEEPVVRQSERLAVYRGVLGDLVERGLVYPCFCSRREVVAELARIGGAPQGLEGEVVYPGTCRGLSAGDRARRMSEAGAGWAWRLDGSAALGGRRLVWRDRGLGERVVAGVGDVVLGRSGGEVAYHLAVVVDDAWQGVSLVTRGMDLVGATGVHRVLQDVLGLGVPEYWHHHLVKDTLGRRLSKRDGDEGLAALRARGLGVGEVLELARGMLRRI